MSLIRIMPGISKSNFALKRFACRMLNILRSRSRVSSTIIGNSYPCRRRSSLCSSAVVILLRVVPSVDSNISSDARLSAGSCVANNQARRMVVLQRLRIGTKCSILNNSGSCARRPQPNRTPTALENYKIKSRKLWRSGGWKIPNRTNHNQVVG